MKTGVDQARSAKPRLRLPKAVPIATQDCLAACFDYLPIFPVRPERAKMQLDRESTLREQRDGPLRASIPDNYICKRINADQPESVPSMSKAETQKKAAQAKI